jgi:hypothetical protein
MDLVIFAGPSLGIPDPGIVGRIDIRPPAACGDIARAAAERPRAIGLIDGLFETVPSVWYKEIIFALGQGIAVFGASSMGALRAVELAPFGMIGIGEVFQAFLNGNIEDDDDVAVLHGPAELGFVTVSEAMVNVRATLRAAAASGTVRTEEALTLSIAAKSLFYKERTWKRIIVAGTEAGVSRFSTEALAAWLPTNIIDLKRRDALDLVHTMLQWCFTSSFHQKLPAPCNTIYWEMLRRRIGLDDCDLLADKGMLR